MAPFYMRSVDDAQNRIAALLAVELRDFDFVLAGGRWSECDRRRALRPGCGQLAQHALDNHLARGRLYFDGKRRRRIVIGTKDQFDQLSRSRGIGLANRFYIARVFDCSRHVATR